MDQRQYEAMLADAEIRLRRLRALYDQWFHGLERAEPQTQKNDIDRLLAELKREKPRNTALRFRLNQLVQRYTTYNTYWQRIARQILEGTYKRDVLRARRRFGLGQAAGAEGESNRRDGYDLDLDIDVETSLKSEPPAAADAGAGNSSSWPAPRSDSERPARAPREITPFALPTPQPPGPPPRGVLGPVAVSAPPALGVPSLRAKGPPPPPTHVSRKPPPVPVSVQPAASGNLSDEQVLDIYQRYVSARRDNRERVDNVRLETVAKTVRDMLPKLKQKHGGKKIDFEVVVKDGRVALKPVAK